MANSWSPPPSVVVEIEERRAVLGIEFDIDARQQVLGPGLERSCEGFVVPPDLTPDPASRRAKWVAGVAT